MDPAVVNPNSMIPMYKQLSKIILSKIESGELKQGERLPSENSLIETYNVSRITIRAAITELVEDGILIRSQGKGTFVSTPKSMYRADDHIGFSRSCALAGKIPTTKVLEVDMILPSASVMQFLNTRENDKVIRTQRLRLVEDVPIMIETNHYPSSFQFLLSENLEGSLFELLEDKYHFSVGKSLRTLEVCFPTVQECKLLKIKQTTPLLLFHDRQNDSEGKPLFTSKQVYCSERQKFYL